jgi:hypothetical protein
MKFFLPAAADEKQAAEGYAAIRKFVEGQIGPLSPTCYYAIYYRHNGKDLRVRVGEPDPLTGELVIAILRAKRPSGPFLICTPNRGVQRGEPILASSDARAVEFENE